MIKVRVYHVAPGRSRAIAHDGRRWHRLNEWNLEGHRVAAPSWHGWALPMPPMTYTLTAPQFGCVLVDKVEHVAWRPSLDKQPT